MSCSMQSGKVACITRELEDLLMMEEERGTFPKNSGSVADLLEEMETAVARVEAQREKEAGQQQEPELQRRESKGPEPEEPDLQRREPQEPEPEPDYRLIGEVFATYIMAERDNEMLLIDKHAAHERILFNRLKRQHQSGAVERQVLLVPLTIHMPRELYDAAIKNLDCFERAGFAAEDFGEGCLRVREVPTILEDIPAEDLLTELCERLLHRGGMDEEAIYDELYHSVACKAAIKGNIPSMEREQQELLQLLREDPTVRNCPHGRPVAIVITRRELERMFGRIV